MKKRVYVIAVLGILLDQATKMIASMYLKNIEIIHGFFDLTYVENTGGAWGILDNHRIILVGVSILTLLVIHKYMNSEITLSRLSNISYGLLLGGIFGNLLDRIFRGAVIDFFHFTFFNYHFPVFNIADILIIIGILLMVVEIVVGGSHENKSRKKQL